MQTAEASGRLEEGLGRLAEYYDRQDALEKKVRSAVTYPAALLLLLGGVLAVLVFGVMPMFQNVYDNVTGGLAASSYAYVLWAEVLSRVGLCVAILASVGLLVLAAVQRRDPEKLRPRVCPVPADKGRFSHHGQGQYGGYARHPAVQRHGWGGGLDSVLLHTEHKDLKAARSGAGNIWERARAWQGAVPCPHLPRPQRKNAPERGGELALWRRPWPLWRKSCPATPGRRWKRWLTGWSPDAGGLPDGLCGADPGQRHAAAAGHSGGGVM